MTVSTDKDNNIVFDKAGWYVLKFVIKVSGNKLNTTMYVAPGKVYVIGNSIDSWEGVPMTAPEGKGLWTFSDFVKSGELRAYIEVPGEEWWRTEFTLYNKETIYYRDFDIPSDWAAGAAEKAKPAKEDPENYSITVGPGMTLSLDFDNNTGSIK